VNLYKQMILLHKLPN